MRTSNYFWGKKNPGDPGFDFRVLYNTKNVNRSIARGVHYDWRYKGCHPPRPVVTPADVSFD